MIYHIIIKTASSYAYSTPHVSSLGFYFAKNLTNHAVSINLPEFDIRKDKKKKPNMLK